MSKRELPEINAGSMADIAFLLLIFFLVTTTMDVDLGIFRKISPKQDTLTNIDVKAKNILEININKSDELFVGNQTIDINKLYEITMDFIDNGSGLDINKEPCSWCNGKKDPKLSEHPSKAIVSITADRETSYEIYVAVLDKINGAYSTLRNRVSKELYNISYTDLLLQLKNQSKNKYEIIEKINNIKEKYPLLISDAEIER